MSKSTSPQFTLTTTSLQTELKEPTPNVYNARATLAKYNITVNNKISSTLQGSVYRGIIIADDIKHDVVIKRTNITLHKTGYIKADSSSKEIKHVNVSENIVKESLLLKYINGKKIPKYISNNILKYYNLIRDSKNYFLIMEYGGKSLYEHIKLYHKFIEKGLLSINEWNKHVRIIFKQICNVINWLHVNNICHLDISVENFTIKDTIFKNGKFISHGNVYIIDFGLSEYFNGKFMCNKRCGKGVYQAYEIHDMSKPFDPRLVDVWALGVVLFILHIGSFPLNKAVKNDIYFCNIMNGHLYKMIKNNNKTKYVDNDTIKLLNCMLCFRKKRYYMHNILKHRYFV